MKIGTRCLNLRKGRAKIWGYKIMYNLYKDKIALIKVEQQRQPPVTKGVRQGCIILSPLLFNVNVES